MEQEYYTINQLIDLLHLSRLSFYRYIKKWELQTYKFWKSHRIKKSDLDKFIKKYKNKKKGN